MPEPLLRGSGGGWITAVPLLIFLEHTSWRGSDGIAIRLVDAFGLVDRPVLSVKIRSPKSRGRGPKTQYSCCKESEIMKFVAAVFQHWNQFISISVSFPGGGVAWGHRAKHSIDDLCRKMRLQHTQTLRYYLREVAAESILASLTADSRPFCCRMSLHQTDLSAQLQSLATSSVVWPREFGGSLCNDAPTFGLANPSLFGCLACRFFLLLAAATRFQCIAVVEKSASTKQENGITV